MGATGDNGARRLPISRDVVDGGFVYRLNGRRIARRREIERIEALAIPPAWTRVEIARSPSTKVLARGVDAAGRVQTVYHPAFHRRMEREKFARLSRFGEKLPALRARIDRDLRRRRLDRDRVVAGAIRLIDLQFLRVGNPEYARRHRSYGATTLRSAHVSTAGRAVALDFRGKSGKRHRQRVEDPRLARLIGHLLELPGHEVFRFFGEDGVVRDVGSRHVNAYVRRAMGEEFSAKDFRTWGGTLIASAELLSLDPAELRTPAEAAAAARRIVRVAAERLGNTPAVTRSSYVDPRVLAAAEDPRLLARVRRARSRMRPRRYQSVDEQSALALLRAADRRAARRRRSGG